MIKVKIKKPLNEYRTQKEMDEIFPGWEEMARLSHGIMQEDELEEKKKESKPNCSAGNPYHSAETGRWTSKEKAGSYSLSEPVKGRSCTSGQSSMPGRKITKKDRKLSPPRCGRANPKSAKKKARVRCHDGENLWETDEEKPTKKIKVRIAKRKVGSMLLAIPPEWIRENKEPIPSTATNDFDEETSAFDEAMRMKDDLVNALSNLTAKERGEVMKQICQMAGFYSINKAAELTNQMALAVKGKLNDEPKT